MYLYLILFTFLMLLELVMDWILTNWEVITLIVTNIGALFMNPPRRKT